MMHELAVCQALMSQVEEIASERVASIVTMIMIGIGPLSGVEAQLLRNAYPIASAGTCAQGAELVIEDLPVKVACDQCGSESEVRANNLVCKECGNWRTTLVGGDEMILVRVELETNDESLPELLH